VCVRGSFEPTLPAGRNLITAADVNGDGFPDYVLFSPITHRSAVWYLCNTSYYGGSYGPGLPAGWILLDALDFNADNKPDYLLFNAADTAQRNLVSAWNRFCQRRVWPDTSSWLVTRGRF
jgi:hypothetical protein